MTQVSQPKQQNVFQGHALTDDELNAVSGGYWGMTAIQAASQQMTFMMSAVDNVIKNIGG